MHIVLVEDDSDICQFLTDLLEDKGHTITTYTKAEIALPILLTQHPDLIIVDHQLAGYMKGDELIAQLRASTTNRLPMIFSTSNQQYLLKTRQQWVDLNVILLPKPYSLSDLFQAIQKACAT